MATALGELISRQNNIYSKGAEHRSVIMDMIMTSWNYVFLSKLNREWQNLHMLVRVPHCGIDKIKMAFYRQYNEFILSMFLKVLGKLLNKRSCQRVAVINLEKAIKAIEEELR